MGGDTQGWGAAGVSSGASHTGEPWNAGRHGRHAGKGDPCRWHSVHARFTPERPPASLCHLLPNRPPARLRFLLPCLVPYLVLPCPFCGQACNRSGRSGPQRTAGRTILHGMAHASALVAAFQACLASAQAPAPQQLASACQHLHAAAARSPAPTLRSMRTKLLPQPLFTLSPLALPLPPPGCASCACCCAWRLRYTTFSPSAVRWNVAAGAAAAAAAAPAAGAAGRAAAGLPNGAAGYVAAAVPAWLPSCPSAGCCCCGGWGRRGGGKCCCSSSQSGCPGEGGPPSSAAAAAAVLPAAARSLQS